MARSARTDTRVDVALAATCGVMALACLILPGSLRERAAATLRTTVVAPLAAMQEKSELSRRAYLAHDAAVRVADSVALRALRLGGVEDENERLRKLLGLGAALQWGFIPAEALHGRGMGDEFTVTLSAGRRAGVQPLSAVVGPEGLVGMVERVDDALSLAILWPHPDFRVSAMTANGSAYGIVSAHLEQGAGRYLLELRGVPLRNELKPGMVVVSSGLGGVYPRGIPIGTIISELRTAEGWARTYLVRPSMRLPDVASVMILKSERGRVGVENIWAASLAALDSAAKGIVAAGDSLRALQAAAADSVKRAVARATVDTTRPTPTRPTP